MFWKKKPNESPFGLPLGALRQALSSAGLEGTWKNGDLCFTTEQATTSVIVSAPNQHDASLGTVRAVIRLSTKLNEQLETALAGMSDESVVGFNRFAGLGAMYREDAAVRIGSRLTIFDQEDSWGQLQCPLLIAAIMSSADAIIGGIKGATGGEVAQSESSAWTTDDFEAIRVTLAKLCFCTSWTDGFTAEFGLSNENLSVVRGDKKTALFKLIPNAPHPKLGGGLLCLLTMPQSFQDSDELCRCCIQLNQMEMSTEVSVPHFGAWCPGFGQGTDLTYVSFIPNILHDCKGIATNFAVWAQVRAAWASRLLESKNSS
jgi:hypothetical protein